MSKKSERKKKIWEKNAKSGKSHVETKLSVRIAPAGGNRQDIKKEQQKLRNTLMKAEGQLEAATA